MKKKTPVKRGVKRPRSRKSDKIDVSTWDMRSTEVFDAGLSKAVDALEREVEKIQEKLPGMVARTIKEMIVVQNRDEAFAYIKNVIQHDFKISISLPLGEGLNDPTWIFSLKAIVKEALEYNYGPDNCEKMTALRDALLYNAKLTEAWMQRYLKEKKELE
ncbi:MAG: hypothetical protein ABIO88_04965 [Burkholderiaceae bacterium]